MGREALGESSADINGTPRCPWICYGHSLGPGNSPMSQAWPPDLSRPIEKQTSKKAKTKSSEKHTEKEMSCPVTL